MKFYILLPIFLCFSSAEKAKFHNYQIYRLTPATELQIQGLAKLAATNEYIYLTFPTKTGRPVDIVVPPHKRPDFHEFIMDEYKFTSIVRMENYQSLLDEEEALLNSRPKHMEWTSYHNLDEIYKWLDELAQKFSSVKTIVGGKTYEGREIRGIEITFGKNFITLFIESGIHACEWIAPAGTNWMINEILNSAQDSVFRKFNYIYFPSFNPDGYVYSWTKYRLWRKTRTPYPTKNKICYGADLNRNWDIHWNEQGATKDPCASNYAGPHAFSEKESKSLSNFIATNAIPKNIDLYIAFHNYYQLLMYPYSHSPNPAPLQKVWKKIGEAAAADLTAVHGTKITVGAGYHTIWPMSGNSGDWVYENLNTTITFLFEMRDTGDYGFVLPAKNIVPVGEEHLAALKRILIEYQKLDVTKVTTEEDDMQSKDEF